MIRNILITIFMVVVVLANYAVWNSARSDEIQEFYSQTEDYFLGVFQLKDNVTGELGEKFFIYNGSIGNTSAEMISEAIASYPDVKKIAFNSTGGIADEATEIGAVLSDNYIAVWIPKGRVCLSACANAFIGGHSYEIEGILGFHAAWLPDVVIESYTPKQINYAFGQFQFAGVHDVYYWVANGFSIQLPAQINANTSPETFLVFRSSEELMAYFVRNDENEAAERQDQLSRYFSFPVQTKPLIWGNTQMVPYLTEQRAWLEDNSTKSANLIEIVYQYKKPTE